MVTLRAHGGGSIFADHREGVRPTLLAMHGWGRNRRDLGRLLDATGHESVAPDLPGFGASPAPPHAWGAAAYADALAEHASGWCASSTVPPPNRSGRAGAPAEHAVGGLSERVAVACGGGPYVLIGHSFGGRVAVCLAAEHPELVSGVVLMGVPLLRGAAAARRPPRRYRIVRAAARARLVSPRRLEAARQRHGSSDYRAASGVMRDVLVRVVNEDYRAELERIRCPVALVWGAQDRVAPLSTAERAAEHLDRLVSLEAVEGAGHDVHLDAPERVAQAVARVVAEVVAESQVGVS